MAKNNWSSDAFKKAQNLLSPGYNQADTFEAVTTLSKEDANALARSMKLDMGVTGYGNTPFDDNQASMNAYFPSINQPEPLPEAETIPLDLYNEPVMSKEDRMKYIEDKAEQGVNWLGNKYNEIFNNGSSNDARDDGKVTADVPEYVKPSADKLAAYEETGLPYNPGNLEAGKIRWKGETGTYKNGRFVWFESPEAGLRAMKIDLTKKLNDFDGNLPAMIEKYASKKDGNDTAAYLKVVQQYAGKKKVYSPSDLDNIMRGFIAMENKAATRDFYFDILDSQ
jgi:hypothetical protein